MAGLSGQVRKGWRRRGSQAQVALQDLTQQSGDGSLALQEALRRGRSRRSRLDRSIRVRGAADTDDHGFEAAGPASSPPGHIIQVSSAVLVGSRLGLEDQASGRWVRDCAGAACCATVIRGLQPRAPLKARTGRFSLRASGGSSSTAPAEAGALRQVTRPHHWPAGKLGGLLPGGAAADHALKKAAAGHRRRHPTQERTRHTGRLRKGPPGRVGIGRKDEVLQQRGTSVQIR